LAITDYWESKDVILTVYSGEVTGQELLESSLQKCGDARFDDIRLILSDWRPATHVDISTDDIKQLVACLRSISQLCPNAKNACVVNRTEVDVAMTAWWKFLADDLSWDVEIFHTMEEARAWYAKSENKSKKTKK